MKVVEGIALPDKEQHYVGTLTRMAKAGESFEYPALRSAMEYLPADRRRVAVDCGAHVGLWSRWLVKRFQYVHAFEPLDEHADLYWHNVHAGNVTLHRKALGEQYDMVAIRQYPENTGQAHVEGKGNVQQLALDYYQLSDVDLVKVDVEGYELAVLKGAKETLTRWKPIVVVEQRGCDEWHYRAPKNEAMDWMQSLGMVPLDCVHFDWIMGWPA